MASNRSISVDSSPDSSSDAPYRGEPWGEGDPEADAEGPSVRGRHRVPKQRGGSMARSGAVLGVGMIAAVGAGGLASAQERPAAAISVPDPTGESPADDADDAAAPAEEAVQDAQDARDAGEALRARILQQAEFQRTSALDATDAADAAGHRAQERAAADARRMAAAAQTAAQQAATQQAAHPAKPKPHHPHPTTQPKQHATHSTHPTHSTHSTKSSSKQHHHGRYTLPVASYTLTAGFGQSGHRWVHRHTGEDFAAPTGTPVRAVGGGRVTHAGWAGAYGYRIVLRLDDGTELWFCHLSSMVVTSGKVAAGTVIGRVGATGNVTGPHLHLEVRPGGGHPIDPLPWLRARGLRP